MRLTLLIALALSAPPVPHRQDRPPGPALSPGDALKRMKVPAGFRVELVAAEPTLVNPVAMTFDDRGRLWVTESVEYPRRSAGPGRDRVKVLESTRGDGTYDKLTVFADGLNIPSGIAVGHGGVWVANAPDILFYREGPDGKAAGKPEVVVTGFGRADTHELPSGLTWGPDGWLYGLNGVFNHSHVRHRGKDFRFTCAVWRLHPRNREFQLFCEGTSNPWGIAFDREGNLFVSACVIDHLWHLAEGGYYQRQAGAYPPFTWPMGSVVRHKHQKAAYCGVHFYDSDAYPAEYRGRMFMGNIHGNCLNADALTRDGSTYLAKSTPDFLTADDAWFMPVAQATGPDGCLYVLDWYDQYHCYQDANRDPAGIDRGKGRLYRVRHGDAPPAGPFDLAGERDAELVRRLGSPNAFFRDRARRLLAERAEPATRAALQDLVLDAPAERGAKMNALWALVGGGPLDPDFHLKVLSHADAGLRAWGVRAAGNQGDVAPAVRDRVVALAADPSPDVRLQVATAARKLAGVDPLPVLARVLDTAGGDRLLPHIVWQNLHPLLEARAGDFLALLAGRDLSSPAYREVVPRAIDRALAAADPDVKAVAAALPALAGLQRRCLASVTDRVLGGELRGDARARLAEALTPVLAKLPAEARASAVPLAAALGLPGGADAARGLFADARAPGAERLRAFAALADAGHRELPDLLAAALAQRSSWRGDLIAAAGRLDGDRTADVLLAAHASLTDDERPRLIDVLVRRPAWAHRLVAAVAEKRVPASALNVNQVRALQAAKDAELAKRVRAVWGTVRDDRNPERERVVREMRDHLRRTPGDPKAGRLVFRNVCAQCHKLHGEGHDVGPDITSNGRNDYDQLVSNVFDPSLVIGAGYTATTVATSGGQVLTGLLVEDGPKRLVLKLPGGKLEVVPRDEVEEVKVGQLSLMPEQLEKQLKPGEVADLFAYLALDKPPEDPQARPIKGAPGR